MVARGGGKSIPGFAKKVHRMNKKKPSEESGRDANYCG